MDFQVMQGLIIIVIVTTLMIISNTYLEDMVYSKVRHPFEKEAE